TGFLWLAAAPTCLLLIPVISTCCQSLSFNVGTAGAKVFSGPATEEFGYTVHQFKNHLGKWLLVGSPWSGYKQDRKGDLYKCEITGSTSNCQRLNLQYYYPGICAEVSPLFKPLPAFSPALQTCGGPMDVAIVLDGSNSIYPWPPVVDFLKKLLENLDIGPDNTQVTIIQYGVDPFIEFHLNAHKTKQSMITAAAKIPQRQGLETNTFRAIEFARKQAFLPENGARPGASKVMVVVTDGESHDKNLRDDVIRKCETDRITRFGIAVLGYYIRNDIDTKNLVDEIKSIASTPTDRYFFNVSAEEALLEIAGSLGDRIFNIEGTGKGDGDFQMEMSQVGFSCTSPSLQNMIMLGAVGAYSWSGTVVHYTSQKSDIFPQTAFQTILQDKNHSSLLGYSVTTLNDGTMEYYVAGAPRSNHTGQVIVYTINAKGQPIVLDSQRGDQIGSYYGSVLCPLDVDKDGVSDLLLVGAPMFMSEHKKENGKVYLLTFTKGILSDQGVLKGPSPAENARFGMSISAVLDLNMDGYSDVVVGAPLEDDNRGVIYVFNGDKKTLRTEYSQRILGSKLDPLLQYFGRSLDTNLFAFLINAFLSPVKTPHKRSSQFFNLNVSCQQIDGWSWFKILNQSNERLFCESCLQIKNEAPDLVNSIGLRVEIALQDPDSSPVLDVLSPNAWQFFIPFSKECGSDEVCDSDLELSVKKGQMIPSSSKMLISLKNKRLSFTVSVVNKKENAYNTRVIVKYSKNLFYASITPPVSFEINFDFNLLERQPIADVRFEVLSDSTEADMSDNHVLLSIPVHYDSEITVSWKMDPEFYVIEANHEVKTTVNTFDDIGPEFKFSLKVSTGNLPISLAYFTVSMPSTTSRGNPLLYITGVTTAPAGDVTCDVTLNPLKITQQPYTPTFSNENLMSTEILDCNTAKCQHMKCFLKDMQIKSAFFVNVTSRIWNGTFAAVSIANIIFGVTISKPGEKGEVPVGIIVGSVIGGLLLLALAIGLLWKVSANLFLLLYCC
uniref:VWFA domain-containing protein n=1 Tax=Esox lucius TaxID=8010 RepID=A0A3P8ZIQ2_ESOLU